VIAANIIAEKLAAEGIEMPEEDRLRLVEHLKVGSDERFCLGDGSQTRRVRVEITGADIAVIDERLERFLDEGVPKVIRSVGEKAAEQILLGLRSSWEEEAEAQRLEREGFHERLRGRWGRGIDLLRMLLTVSREFGDMVRIQWGGTEDCEMPVLIGVLLRLHARACQVSDEIICLLEAGFSDGAMARWRTLHEIAAVALLLNQHGEAVAQRYVDHEVIESARAARDYEECRELLGDDPMSEAELEEIHRGHEEAVAAYGPCFDSDYGWAAEALA
jgi:hypothetical protein